MMDLEALAPVVPHDPMPKPGTDGWTLEYRANLSDWCERNAALFGEAVRYECDQCRDSGFIVVSDTGPTTVRRCGHGRARFDDRPLTYREAIHAACKALPPGAAAWVVEPDAKSAGDLAYRLCSDQERHAEQSHFGPARIVLTNTGDAPEGGVWPLLEEVRRRPPALLVIVVSLGVSWEQAKHIANLIRAGRGATTFVIGQRPETLGDKIGGIVMQQVEARGGSTIATHVAASFGGRAAGK